MMMWRLRPRNHNPHLAAQTGFDKNGEDLKLFWQALGQMFESDRSAARGEMAARGLIVFRHDSPLGNAPAHQLFARVHLPPLTGPKSEGKPPRSFEDYAAVLKVDRDGLPAGISVEEPL